MISLDGSTLEGGGQLLRASLSLSAITSTPIHVYNIRANRAPQGGRRSHHPSKKHATSKKPEGGLKESHLAALNFLADSTDATVEGAEVGSREIVFKPSRKEVRKHLPRRLEMKLRRPGSVWLIWQAVWPYLVFGGWRHAVLPDDVERQASDADDDDGGRRGENRKIEIVLKGGTNASKAMSSEYVTQVFLPVCEKIGLPSFEVDVVRRGWAGSTNEVGEVKVRMELAKEPFLLRGFEVKDRGEVEKVVVSIVAYGRVREMVRSQIVEAVAKRLTGPEVEIRMDEDSGDERRLYVLLVAHTSNGWRLGRDVLGTGKQPKNEAERRKIVTEAVETVVRDLEQEVKRGGCVDDFMQDQLVVFQALAKGNSSVDAGETNASLHTRTVRWVCTEVVGAEFGEQGQCHAQSNAGVGEETEAEDALAAKLGKVKLNR